MKTAFSAILLAGAAVALESNDLVFVNFVSKFGKMYDTVEEYHARREIFLARDLLIQQHMSRPSNYTMGHNKFSDWSELEMSMILGEKEFPESNAYCQPPPNSHTNVEVPAYVNWVEAGKTTPVKNQG